MLHSKAARILILFLATSLTFFGKPPAANAVEEPKRPSAAQIKSSTEARRLEITTKPWQGDFDGMLERRAIRVYVPYSRSLYFIDQGRERGISALLIREFERWLNKKYAKQLGRRPITISARNTRARLMPKARSSTRSRRA